MRAYRKDQAAVVTSVSQRFERDRRRKRIEAAAIVFFRNRQALQSQLAAFEPEIAREHLIPVALDHPFIQLFGGESYDRVSEDFLLLGERKIHLFAFLQSLVVDLVRRGLGQPVLK